MKIIYDLEKFAIEEMFKPYEDLIVAKTDHYDETVARIIKDIKADPGFIIFLLGYHKEAYDLVFDRLARMDFKFYKHLNSSFINYVNNTVAQYRAKNLNSEKE